MTQEEIKHLISEVEKGKFIEKMVATKALKKHAETHPEDIVPHYPSLLNILKDKNAKVTWASFFLIEPIAKFQPEMAFENLGLFGSIADGASVIARDVYVRILGVLATQLPYYETCITLLIDEVLKAPVNQLASYAKTASSVVVDVENAALLSTIIISRIPDTEAYPPKTKKLQAIIKQLAKLK